MDSKIHDRGAGGRKDPGSPTLERIVGLLARSSIQSWMHNPKTNAHAVSPGEKNGLIAKSLPLLNTGYGEVDSSTSSHTHQSSRHGQFSASSYDTLLCQALSSALVLPRESPPTMRSSPPSAQKRKRTKSEYARYDKPHSPILEDSCKSPTRNGSPTPSQCTMGQFSTSPIPMSTIRVKPASTSPNPKSPKTPRRGDQLAEGSPLLSQASGYRRKVLADVDMVSVDELNSSPFDAAKILKPASVWKKSTIFEFDDRQEPLPESAPTGRATIVADNVVVPNAQSGVALQSSAEQPTKINELGEDSNQAGGVEGTKSAFTGMI